MRHVKAISKRPRKGEEIPVDLLLAFVIGVLTSLESLLQAKAGAEEAPTT